MKVEGKSVPHEVLLRNALSVDEGSFKLGLFFVLQIQSLEHFNPEATISLILECLPFETPLFQQSLDLFIHLQFILFSLPVMVQVYPYALGVHRLPNV